MKRITEQEKAIARRMLQAIWARDETMLANVLAEDRAITEACAVARADHERTEAIGRLRVVDRDPLAVPAPKKRKAAGR